MTEGGELPPNTIFKMSNKLIWVVKNFEVLASDLTERIGNPSNFDMSSLITNLEAAENPTPATPSPSSRGASALSSVPPAGPSKRSHDASDREDDRYFKRFFFHSKGQIRKVSLRIVFNDQN